MAKKTNPKPAATNTPAPKPATATKPLAEAPAKPKKSLSVTTLICIGLAVISLLVYFNTLGNGYVLDDNVVTTKNTIVNKGFDGIPELLRTPRMTGVAYFKNDNYRPLSLVMFAAEVELFGSNPMVGHLFNIIFFAGCVVLLFLFIDKLFGRQKTVVALIASLLFAVHPIHTEVVANIKSRDEIMCFFFAFVSMNLYLNYMEKGKILSLIGGIIAFFLAFISKETVFTFLAIVPMVFFFYRNENRTRAIFITTGTVVAFAVFWIIRTRVLDAYGCSTTAIEFIDNALVKAPSVSMKIGTAILVLGKYLYLLFIPHPLINDYCFNSIPYVGFDNIWVLLTTVIYLALAGLAAFRFLKDQKDPWAFSIVFFLATLSLFSNIPFLIGTIMGERFLFFASVGFCLAVGLAIEKWIIKGSVTVPEVINNKVVLGIMISVCLLFSGLTIARNADWKDNYTLFRTDLAKQPNDSRLYFYLGDEMAETVFPNEKDPIKQKQIIRESINYLKKSVEIYPLFTDAHTETGKAYLLAEMYDSAVYHLRTAISQSPYQSIAANNLGTVYMRTSKFPEAIEAYKLALTINPVFVQASFNLGCCYVQTHQYDSAIYHLTQAVTRDPNYVDAYMQMGMAYFQTKQYDKAEPLFKKALEINPGDVNAVNNLGAIYLNQNKYPQAIEIFKKAIAMNPNYVNAYSNLGHCYFQLKQYQATIDILNKSLSLDPKHVNDIPFLALSYQGLGNMDMARRYEAEAKKYYSNFKLE